jgi:hypothetical protein
MRAIRGAENVGMQEIDVQGAYVTHAATVSFGNTGKHGLSTDAVDAAVILDALSPRQRNSRRKASLTKVDIDVFERMEDFAMYAAGRMVASIIKRT